MRTRSRNCFRDFKGFRIAFYHKKQKKHLREQSVLTEVPYPQNPDPQALLSTFHAPHGLCAYPAGPTTAIRPPVRLLKNLRPLSSAPGLGLLHPEIAQPDISRQLDADFHRLAFRLPQGAFLQGEAYVRINGLPPGSALYGLFPGFLV